MGYQGKWNDKFVLRRIGLNHRDSSLWYIFLITSRYSMTISKMLDRQRKSTCDAKCGSGRGLKWTRYEGFRGVRLLPIPRYLPPYRVVLVFPHSGLSGFLDDFVLGLDMYWRLALISLNCQSSASSQVLLTALGVSAVEGEGEEDVEEGKRLLLTPLSPMNFPIFLRFSSMPSPSSQVMGHG